jgi:hypothetical protein
LAADEDHPVFALARNHRLEEELADDLAQAKAQYQATGKPARVFRDFRWRTLESWSRERRVVGKAEHSLLGANPRYVVTSLNDAARQARPLHGNLYFTAHRVCAGRARSTRLPQAS